MICVESINNINNTKREYQFKLLKNIKINIPDTSNQIL